MSRIALDRHSRPRTAPTFRAAAALVVAIAASTAWAQDVRIGYVDMKVLFDTAPQIDSAREALDQEFTPRNEAVVADEVRLERMEADLAAAENLGAEERYEMEREIRNLRRSIERRREDLNEEMRFRVNAEKKELEETIEVAVRQVAEDGDFDLILTSPVAFASDRIDVTDRVLQWLEEDFRNQQDDVGGAP